MRAPDGAFSVERLLGQPELLGTGDGFVCISLIRGWTVQLSEGAGAIQPTNLHPLVLPVRQQLGHDDVVARARHVSVVIGTVQRRPPCRVMSWVCEIGDGLVSRGRGRLKTRLTVVFRRKAKQRVAVTLIVQRVRVRQGSILSSKGVVNTQKGGLDDSFVRGRCRGAGVLLHAPCRRGCP